MTETTTRCELCRDTGWRIEARDGADVAVRCSCRRERNPESVLRSCRIPERYLHCSLESFEIWPQDAAHARALQLVRKRVREFVDCYPAVERGLLLAGRVGTGKTHLAVAALRELVLGKGVDGLYVDFMELIQQLQMSFDGDGATRRQLLGPVVEADLLVLDELGSGKTGPWAQDMLYFIVNSRYLARRITIGTTNFMDKPSAGEESLADRVSRRVRSRLFEMCETVGLHGEDYREHVLGRRKRDR